MSWITKMRWSQWIHLLAFLGLSIYFTHFILVDSDDGLLAVGYKHFGQILLTLFMAVVPPLVLSTVAVTVLKLLVWPVEALFKSKARRPGVAASDGVSSAEPRPTRVNGRSGSESAAKRNVMLDALSSAHARLNEDEDDRDACEDWEDEDRGDEDLDDEDREDPVIMDILGMMPCTEDEEDDDHTDVAGRLLSVYTARHFTGDSAAVVDALKAFLLPRMRTLLTEDLPLGAAARVMVDCKDDPDIRAWSVDLLGRVGGDADIPKIVEMANEDADPRVRQEATAALGKYLRFRGGGEEVLAGIQFTREEDDDKVLRAREMASALLAGKG